ncbi:MAG: response regulator [Anaerolineae bacterium]|nr:response regulator [Anaerolineae bacterium]
MGTVVRVLHVDDSLFDRQLVRDALESQGDQFMVTEAASAQEFRDCLSANVYDLILTDFNILGYEGLQIINAVHQISPHLPVIVLTGTGSEEIAVEAMKRGAADYVIKNPHHIRRLPMAILSALEQKRLRAEHAQSVEALKASEAYLRAVVAGTPVILFAVDTCGILTLLQGRGLGILQDEPETWIGQPLFDSDRQLFPDVRDCLQRALRGEEISSVQASGEAILDIRYSPLRQADGAITGVIGVAADITERLQAQRLQIELEKEHEVIALKERLVATASHDFRTPLSVIKMSASLLANYYERLPSEQRVRKLSLIQQQADQLTRLLDDFLILSKGNAGKLTFKPERVVLRQFCERIVDSFLPIAEKTHSIALQMDCDQEFVVFDPALVSYILINLISNAIKYSPIDGHVWIDVTCDDAFITFQVRDNGIGIPRQDQEKLFDPFFRASNVSGFEGTGLGLSIVKTYAEAHRGVVEFVSQENQGTTFRVMIPLMVDGRAG